MIYVNPLQHPLQDVTINMFPIRPFFWSTYFCLPEDTSMSEANNALCFAHPYNLVQDLRERLWDMSDKRREEDSQEKNSLVENGWLEDHKAFLINHFATLIQVSLMTKFIISHSQQQVVSFYYKVQSITQVHSGQ